MAEAVLRAAAPESKQEEQRKSTIKVTTLGELGKKLPIGALSNGGLLKDFSTRPWKTRDDRELGREQKKNESASRYIGQVVRRMCPTLGDYKRTDYSDDELEKALAKIGQLFSGDVFYAYVTLRIEAMGKDLPLQIVCGACEHNFKYVGDLNSIEVTTVDDPQDLSWEFELVDGAELRGKQHTKFRMGPLRWSLMNEAYQSGRNGTTVNINAIKITTACNAITGLGDDPTPVMLSDQDLDDVSKLDLERLIKAVDEHSLGPAMVIEGACPKCSSEFRRPIDWEAGSFFAISSRS